MKKIIYILIGICLGVFGCIHDETTGPHLDISDLSTTFEDSVIYITSTENLRLDAGSFIVQTDSNCPLEYTWSAGKITGWNTSTEFWQLDSMAELSHEQVLDYNFKELGRHLLRLKVVNQYTAYIQYFIVNVSSGFDEGIVLFSKNEAGNGMFSFLNSPKGIDTLLSMNAENFNYVTGEDDPYLNEDICDFIFYSGYTGYPDYGTQILYLLSRKNKQAYSVDEYTLHTIPSDMFKFSKTPECLTLHWHSGTTRTVYDLFAFTEDGDVISYCTKYQMEMPRMAFDSIHHWDRYSIGGGRMSSDSKNCGDILWLYDDEKSTLYGMYANDMQQASTPSGRINDYIGPKTFEGQEIVNVSYALNQQWGLAAPLNNDVYIITRDKEDPKKTQMHVWFFVPWGENFVKGFQSATYDRELKAGEELSLQKGVRVLPLHERAARFYHNGQKVFHWGKLQHVPLTSTPHGRYVFDIKQVNPNAEIVDINLYIDKKVNKYYVLIATYDPTSASDKKGSVYVVGAEDLSTVVAKYENVAYKPLNIYYKINQ